MILIQIIVSTHDKKIRVEATGIQGAESVTRDEMEFAKWMFESLQKKIHEKHGGNSQMIVQDPIKNDETQT